MTMWKWLVSSAAVAALAACASTDGGGAGPSPSTPNANAKRNAAFVSSQLKTRFGSGSLVEELDYYVREKGGICRDRVVTRVRCELPISTYECVVTYVDIEATADNNIIRALTTTTRQKPC